MKNLRTAAVCLSVLLGSLCSSAQTGETVPINEPNYNRVLLFQDKPAELPLSKELFTSLLSAPVGRTVSVSLSEETGFRFEGEVVSAVSKYNNTIQSVVLRSSNFHGARLTLTKTTAADGSISYSGRLLSMQHGDLYELKTAGTELLLVKKKFYDLVNE